MLRIAIAALVALAATAVRAERLSPICDADRLEMSSALEIDLSRNQPGAPQLVPRARYGVSEQLTLGVVAGLPLTSVDRSRCAACDHPRGGAFADAAYELRRTDRLQIAARVRAGSAAIDALHAAVAFGAAGTVAAGAIRIDVDPHVLVALSGGDDGNEHLLALPLWVSGRPQPWLELSLRTGVVVPLSHLTDAFSIAGGGGAAVIEGRWRAGVEFYFPRLAGPVNSGRLRSAFVYVQVALDTR